MSAKDKAYAAIDRALEYDAGRPQGTALAIIGVVWAILYLAEIFENGANVNTRSNQ